MKMASHGNLNLFKYTYGSVIQGASASLQGGVVIGHDVDVRRYGEALKMLEKAKKELSLVHAELLEMFVYGMVAEKL